jgi:hypothetical protein
MLSRETGTWVRKAILVSLSTKLDWRTAVFTEWMLVQIGFFPLYSVAPKGGK